MPLKKILKCLGVAVAVLFLALILIDEFVPVSTGYGFNHKPRPYWIAWLLAAVAGLATFIKMSGTTKVLAQTVTTLREVREEVADRVNESSGQAHFYAIAENEVNEDSYDRGLWSRALVEAKGNEDLRKVEYIRLRVRQLQRGQQ